jgi:hypothetical protein
LASPPWAAAGVASRADSSAKAMTLFMGSIP